MFLKVCISPLTLLEDCSLGELIGYTRGRTIILLRLGFSICEMGIVDQPATGTIRRGQARGGPLLWASDAPASSPCKFSRMFTQEGGSEMLRSAQKG